MMGEAMRIRLRHLVDDVDRYGNVRYYVRLRGKPKVRIRGIPGCEEFMAAYHEALAGMSGGQRQARAVARGSLRQVCQAYFGSATFKSLDPATREWRRRHLELICKKHGEKPVAMMKPKHVRQLRDELAEMPSKANLRLQALQALFKWAVEDEEAPHNPAYGVQRIKYVSEGFHSWSLDEVAAFEKRHSIGTKPRLAMALLLYTTCRREDAVRLGPQHVQAGRLKYRQAKNEHRSPVDMDIPVHPDLQEIIDATPSGHLRFLVTESGRGLTRDGFGSMFRDWCNQANLPHCSAHGLRKATSARLAERGCTPHEIMAITGHKTLKEVERYTLAAQKAGLADSAMAKLKR
jgi:integrase/recombinase XerD